MGQPCPLEAVSTDGGRGWVERGRSGKIVGGMMSWAGGGKVDIGGRFSADMLGHLGLLRLAPAK